MEEMLTLHVKTRTELGRGAVESLRKQSLIPAVIYGKHTPNTAVSIDSHQFAKIYVHAGESSLVNVVIDDQAPVKVIIHDVQRDPLGNREDFFHVDLYQVNMTEKIKAEIELVFEGEAPAVKNLGGVLVKNITHLQVECLPADLPHNLVIDVTTLGTFDDLIRVSDLAVPQGVEILHEPEDTIATVSEPRSEAELSALDEQVVENVEAVETAQPAKEKEDAEGTETAEAQKEK